MTGSRFPLSPVALLVLGTSAFAGWIAYDGTRPVPGSASEVLVPEPVVHPRPSIPVCVVEGEPPLEVGMPREIVERLVGPVAPEEAETTRIVEGVSVRRVNYRVCLVGGRESPSGWSRVTVEYEDSPGAQVVSHVTVMPLPEPPGMLDPLPELEQLEE